MLHVHGLANAGEEQRWAESLVERLEGMGPFNCQIEYVEKVKWYAPVSVTLWWTFVSCQYELKNLIRYGIGMDLGIENEALAFAIPYVLGFIGTMYALLGIFTITKWKQSQETIRNLWKRTLVATPLLIVIFAAMHLVHLHGAYFRNLRRWCPSRILHGHPAGGQRNASGWNGRDCGHRHLGMDPELTEMSVFAWAGPNAAGLLGLSLFLGAFATWAIPIIQDRSENVTSEVGRALIGFVLIWFFIHGVYLMHLGEEVVGAAIFAVLNVAINDSMALVFGRIFGKNKFRPVLSPKKTWEGVFGGLYQRLWWAIWLNRCCLSLLRLNRRYRRGFGHHWNDGGPCYPH